jgi:site-specific recombinase XerD
VTWINVTDDGEALIMKTHQDLDQYSVLVKNARFLCDLHKGQEVIFIFCKFDPELIQIIRRIPGSKWSQSRRAWYVLDREQLRAHFQIPKKSYEPDSLDDISSGNARQLERFMEQIKLQGYSPHTLRTYTSEFRVYLRDLKHRPVQEVTYEQLRLYFVYLIDKKGLGENQIHSRINALKFYYEQVLLWERFSIEIPRPKKQLQLPKVLSFEEVQRILTATGNIKHMLILSLCYGTGIRLSEIVNIEIEDMDLYRYKVFIRRGKGKKDRYVNLPTSIIVLLGQYMNIYKPQRYLFEGQYGGRYSVRSVQSVFMQAKHRAGVYKKMGIHGLRHSFATHCHEQGTDLHLLQRLLGHSNIKTTLIYTHVSQRQLEMVVSPLDRMLKELGPDMKQISSKRGGNNT